MGTMLVELFGIYTYPLALLICLIVVLLTGFFIMRQDQIGVLLTFGKFSSIVTPGLKYQIPFIQQVIRTNSSLQTIDLPDQKIVLSGNIAITISGILNFRVKNPRQALLEVADYKHSIEQFALTTISDVLGTKSIEELRTEKIKTAQLIEDVIRKITVQWGLKDIDIRLTDAVMDESLLRAMMRETEAKKEAIAIKIKAESDLDTAKTFSAAADILSASPGALTLRTLQALSDISNEKSTVVIPIPIELLSNFSWNSAQNNQEQDLSNLVVEREEKDEVPKSGGKEGLTFAEIAIKGKVIIAGCPKCSKKYNVSGILGDMDFDQRPDIPGQQVVCKQCQTILTLPPINQPN